MVADQLQPDVLEQSALVRFTFSFEERSHGCVPEISPVDLYKFQILAHALVALVRILKSSGHLCQLQCAPGRNVNPRSNLAALQPQAPFPAHEDLEPLCANLFNERSLARHDMPSLLVVPSTDSSRSSRLS
eukprot:3008386-Amphidinium_carterae.1